MPHTITTTEHLAKLTAAAVECAIKQGGFSPPVLYGLVEEIRSLTEWLHQVNLTAAAVRVRLRFEVATARLIGQPIPEQYRRREKVKIVEQVSAASVSAVERLMQQLTVILAADPAEITALAGELRTMTVQIQQLAAMLQEISPPLLKVTA